MKRSEEWGARDDFGGGGISQGQATALFLPKINPVLTSGPLDISAATAGQIVFPAVQNASAGLNTLDDYNEGTWTPFDASGAALVVSPITPNTYTKIGRLVTVQFGFKYAINVDATAMKVGGLPYLSLSTSSPSYGGAFTLFQGAAGPLTVVINRVDTSFLFATTSLVPVTNSVVSNNLYTGVMFYYTL